MTGTAAIIVAAGLGSRAGGDKPKQWQKLAGRRVLDWTLDVFREAPGVSEIVLVLHPQLMERAPEFPDLTVVAGGETRSDSVKAGLAALSEAKNDRVLIHDAARPLVTQRIITDVIEALTYAEGAAPALEVTDALWHGAEGTVKGTVDRTGLYRAQTPQGFKLEAIRAAHDDYRGHPADDVQVARADGMDVVMVPGDERNLKLTRPADFARAEAILRADMDIRIGNGFDVHRFGNGDHVTLCGIKVPHSHRLMGHSDADVGMHAVTDAIYGALSMGDIGRHFPPSDDQWKDADSAKFLRHAVQLATARGFRISNVDLTLVCERPKIGPHATEMALRMGQIMGLDPGRVSVKATTSERLGFTGREEGIAAVATALLTGA